MSDFTMKFGEQKALTDTQRLIAVGIPLFIWSSLVGGVSMVSTAVAMGFWAAIAAGIGGSLVGAAIGIHRGINNTVKLDKMLQEQYEKAHG